MSMMATILEVRGLTVELPTTSGWIRPVNDVSFTLNHGETLGMHGESGSGKTMLSLALMGLEPHGARHSGEAWLASKSGQQNILASPAEELRAIRGRDIAMIFQEPMTALNPVMRVGEQIAEAVAVHAQVTTKAAWDRAVAVMEEVAIPSPALRARDYPYQLSGGMRQRVMIAMAVVNRPTLLIADEPTTALDVTVQAQILDLLAELRDKFGLAMLFISHDLAVVSHVADRIAVMYAGNLVELGSKREIFQAPAHPYTRGLLNAVPTLKPDRTHPLKTIEGTVPPMHAIPPGCPFEPRCDFREPQCR